MSSGCAAIVFPSSELSNIARFAPSAGGAIRWAESPGSVTPSTGPIGTSGLSRDRRRALGATRSGIDLIVATITAVRRGAV